MMVVASERQMRLAVPTSPHLSPPEREYLREMAAAACSAEGVNLAISVE